MDALLVIHFDSADGQEVWWAESPEVPGFTASADNLPELRTAIANVLPDLSSDAGEDIVFAAEQLADVTPNLPDTVVVESDQAPGSVANRPSL